MQISMQKSRRYLATLWFAFGCAVFLIVLGQAFFGHYGADVAQAWGWLLPTIMPTLSLIIGVLVAETRYRNTIRKTVDHFTFRIAFSLSLLYLLVVLLTIIIQPISPIPPLELMKQSHLWLGPFQGLVSASIGVFFVRAEDSTAHD
jgi:hypothetical protein